MNPPEPIFSAAINGISKVGKLGLEITKFPIVAPLVSGAFIGVVIRAVKLMSSLSNTGTKIFKSSASANPTCGVSPFQTGANPITVSYTHLTLPTTSSV